MEPEMEQLLMEPEMEQPLPQLNQLKLKPQKQKK